ncbi:MAG TPA: M20/M25/M40 family metallo-hydrolase [Gemmatimonadales bacterium]|nr:M20/M25/M40 family metallo-hydrolase [Gemmatimonadales bacterium]
MHRSFVTLAAILLAVPPLTAQSRSADYTAPYQRQALEIYRETIALRTAKGQGLVPDLAKRLATRFRDAGFPAADIHVLPLTLPDGEQTASLVVRYRGDGSSGLKPVLLTAHMDVVDAKPEDWVRDPFSLTEEDGYFFGRGTTDDKAGVTMLTTTFLRLRAEGWIPTRDLVIAFTGDEETLMLTTQDLGGTHRDLIDAEYALNADAGGGILDEDGRPLRYLIETSEKTYATFELTVTNPGGHSSTPRADNAIYQLADALKRLQAFRFPVETNAATRAYFMALAPITPGPVGRAMGRLARDPADSAAAEILWHEPEQVGITRTTCIATMLRAGHAENALPQSATATVNCRIFPGTEVAAVQGTLQRVVADTGVHIVVLDTPLSSPASPIRDDILGLVRAGVERIHPGTPVIPQMAPYATDGKFFRRAGIPTYGIVGLFNKDSDGMAHGLNERTTVKAFFDALEFWDVVLRRVGGRPTT